MFIFDFVADIQYRSWKNPAELEPSQIDNFEYELE